MLILQILKCGSDVDGCFGSFYVRMIFFAVFRCVDVFERLFLQFLLCGLDGYFAVLKCGSGVRGFFFFFCSFNV